MSQHEQLLEALHRNSRAQADLAKAMRTKAQSDEKLAGAIHALAAAIAQVAKDDEAESAPVAAAPASPTYIDGTPVGGA